MKRLLSLLLIMAMLLTLLPAAAFADGDGAAFDTSIGAPEYSADTSLGTLLMRTLENDREDASFPGTVTDLTAENKTVTVSLSVDRTALLVVAIYPDSDTDVQMLASGETMVESGMWEAPVVIDIASMPEYYIAAAYLLDPETNEPLSDSYISRYYTAEFQAFLRTSTDDYDQDLVLNLDGDDTNNFLVFDKSVLRFTETPGVNELSDNGDGSYTVSHADARFRALKAGDSFAYTYADGTILIVSAASVSLNGDTVTVVEDTEATLQTVFEFIKIDTASVPGEGVVDMESADNMVCYSGSELAELNTYEAAPVSYGGGVEERALSPEEYEGSVSYDEESGMTEVDAILSTRIDTTLGTTFKFEIEPIEDAGGFLFKGNVSFGVSATVKVYQSRAWFSSTVKFDYSAGYEVEIGAEGGFEKEIKLGEPTVPLAASGVTVSFPLKFVVEAEVKATLSGTFTGTFGFNYDSDYGYTDLTSKPSFESELEFSGQIFVGFEYSTKVSLMIRKMFSFEAGAKLGADITGKLRGSQYEDPSDSKRHLCRVCIQGDIKLRFSITLKFDALFGVVKRSWTPLNLSVKLWDFYYSLDERFKEFGWNKTCPHIEYKVTVEVYDENGEKLEKAVVSCDGRQLGRTNADGKLSLYLPNGAYALKVDKGELSVTKDCTVRDGMKSVRIDLTVPSTVDPTTDVVSGGGVCGENLKWELYADGTLVISGSGEMYHYKSPYDVHNYGPEYLSPWYGSAASIQAVRIKEGVSAIGNCAFCGCTSLTRVSIADSVFSIGERAFGACDSLSSIQIPRSVVSIGPSAFWGCDSLASVRIPTSVITIGNAAFSSCHSLRTITLPSSITEIEANMFSSCENLAKVTIPSSVISVGAAVFSNCTGLQELTMPDSVVTLGASAFRGCTALTSVKLSNALSSIGDTAFETCTSLETITIPNSVESMGESVFQDCASLTGVKLSNTLTTIGAYAFKNCTSLKSMTIPDSVTYIGREAFYKCSSLTGAKLSKSLEHVPDKLFCYCTSLTGITIPDSVGTIGTNAFEGCTSLADLKIGNSVFRIWEYAFMNCKSLTSVRIPDSVIEIKPGVFSGCSNLTRASIGISVSKIMGYVFSSTKLTDIYYAGTEEQWASITIFVNPQIKNATIHYNAVMPDDDTPILAEPLAAYTGELSEQNGLRLAAFSGLRPGGAYVLLVTADAAAPLSSANLLYIAQGTADGDGRLILSYIPRLDSVGDVKLYGGSSNDLSQADISVEQFGDGECRVTVSFGGTTLEEDADYLLTTREDGLTLTATVTGRGDYSGSKTVEGEKLASTVRFELNDGQSAAVRQAKLVGRDMTLPAATRVNLALAGWAAEKSAHTPDYLPGDSYTADADVALYAVWTFPEAPCVLPAALLRVEDEAFRACAFPSVSLSEGVSSIGELAFADSPGLLCIYIPESVTSIADNAFENDAALSIYGVAGSRAESFAANKGLPFIALR